LCLIRHGSTLFAEFLADFLRDADEFLGGVAAVAACLAADIQRAPCPLAVELIKDHGAIVHAAAHQRVGDEGHAQTRAGGVVGGHLLVEIDDIFGLEARFQKDAPRPLVHIVAPLEKQKGFPAQILKGYTGAVGLKVLMGLHILGGKAAFGEAGVAGGLAGHRQKDIFLQNGGAYILIVGKVIVQQQVDLAQEQLFPQRGAGRFAELETDAGIAAGELTDDAGQQEEGDESGRGNGEIPRFGLLEIVELVDKVLLHAVDLLHGLDVGLARVGKGDGGGGAVKKLGADLLLRLFDGGGEGGLGNIEILGRHGEAFFLIDLVNIIHAAEHRVTSCVGDA